MQEVRNSIVFGSSQFRGWNVKEIILCGEYGGDEGLRAEIEGLRAYMCHMADPWMAWSIEENCLEEYGWEATIGLAARDKS